MRISVLFGCLFVAFSLFLVGCGGKNEEKAIEDEIAAVNKEAAGAGLDAGKLMENVTKRAAIAKKIGDSSLPAETKTKLLGKLGAGGPPMPTP
jgi:hypothetical protein